MSDQRIGNCYDVSLGEVAIARSDQSAGLVRSGPQAGRCTFYRRVLADHEQRSLLVVERPPGVAPGEVS